MTFITSRKMSKKKCRSGNLGVGPPAFLNSNEERGAWPSPEEGEESSPAGGALSVEKVRVGREKKEGRRNSAERGSHIPGGGGEKYGPPEWVRRTTKKQKNQEKKRFYPQPPMCMVESDAARELYRPLC